MWVVIKKKTSNVLSFSTKIFWVGSALGDDKREPSRRWLLTRFLFVLDAMESNNKPVLPYNMETMDDIILYSSLHQSSVKNLWAGEKSSKNESTCVLL